LLVAGREGRQFEPGAAGQVGDERVVLPQGGQRQFDGFVELGIGAGYVVLGTDVDLDIGVGPVVLDAPPDV
jgi:hypothetical protein